MALEPVSGFMAFKGRQCSACGWTGTPRRAWGRLAMTWGYVVAGIALVALTESGMFRMGWDVVGVGTLAVFLVWFSAAGAVNATPDRCPACDAVPAHDPD